MQLIVDLILCTLVSVTRIVLHGYRIFREIIRGLYVVFSYFHADAAYSMMRFFFCSGESSQLTSLSIYKASLSLYKASLSIEMKLKHYYAAYTPVRVIC